MSTQSHEKYAEAIMAMQKKSNFNLSYLLQQKFHVTAILGTILIRERFIRKIGGKASRYKWVGRKPTEAVVKRICMLVDKYIASRRQAAAQNAPVSHGNGYPRNLKAAIAMCKEAGLKVFKQDWIEV